MAVLYGYYAAADDEHAAAAIVRDDEGPDGAGYDELVVKGIDPTVYLLPAESLLTGRYTEDLTADRRHCRPIAVAGDGEVVSVSLTDSLRDSIATFDTELLGDVAVGWSVSDVFASPPEVDELAEFLNDLAALARRAVARRQRLYCWACP
ncbi:hypothetical protein ACWEQL_26200 [Kitasatospora sp. NPDC004240]